MLLARSQKQLIKQTQTRWRADMTDHNDEQQPEATGDTPVELERRNFLRSLGKWSQAVIGGVVAGGALTIAGPAEGWYNRPGGWYNGHGGWYNRHGGGWYNGHGGWYNRHGGGGWYNRHGGWYNRHGGWYNRHGGGGWYNRHGGWYNR